jgi:peptide/nickel transport system permease protein
VTLPLQDPQLAVEAEGQPSTRSGFFRTVLRERKAAVVGLSIIVFFVVLSIIAPYISPYSVTVQTCAVYAPPSGAHWLGCDDGGIDMLSELMQGGRISLIVGFAATLVAMIIGGGVGILSGYFGRATDIVLMRITDYLLVIPDLVLMIVIADVWGASLFHVIIVIGILEWTSTARIIRAQVMSLRERVYVKRTRALGAGNARIIFKHILPQVGPLLIANTVLTIAIAIYLETALAFLGLEDPTVITWGTILEHAFERTAISSGAWWAIVPAGLVIAAVIVGCFLFGQAVEDALNPRLKVVNLSVRRWRLRPLVGRGPDAL